MHIQDEKFNNIKNKKLYNNEGRLAYRDNDSSTLQGYREQWSMKEKQSKIISCPDNKQ